MRLKSSILTLLTMCALILSTALSPIVSAQNGVRYIHQERSLYRNIVVTEDSSRRCMRFTITVRQGQNQSCRFLDNHDKLVFPYAKMVLSSLLIQNNPERILILGLGGGTLVHSYHRLFPDADISVVEIDEAVIKVAGDYFDFNTDDKTQAHAVDGRVFVKRAVLRKQQYDLVILDAFNGEYIPEHLMTQEFLEEVKQLLPAQGMVVANTFSSSDLYDAESRTYQQVFGEFFNIRKTGTGNRVIIASMQPLPDQRTLASRANELQSSLQGFDMDVRDYPPLMKTKPDWNNRARVLTDQYSPANLLNH